jgi:AraC-like DNA-binding protein
VEACLAYRWPENLAEFERLLGRLATMTGTAPIGASDILRYAPEMACEAPNARSSDRVGSHATNPTALDRWALRALDPEDCFVELDPRWPRPCVILVLVSRKAIDLTDLAAIGGTTPPRMSALFRSVIGASFKKLLRQIRILAACERLVQQPATSITPARLPGRLRRSELFRAQLPQCDRGKPTPVPPAAIRRAGPAAIAFVRLCRTVVRIDPEHPGSGVILPIRPDFPTGPGRKPVAFRPSIPRRQPAFSLQLDSLGRTGDATQIERGMKWLFQLM